MSDEIASSEPVANEPIVNDEVVVDELIESSEIGEQQDESNDVLEESGEASESNDDVVKEAVKMVKQLNIKVDGEEFIEELPFEVTPEQAEYIKKQTQLAKMAQKRAQETAELRKNQTSRDAELNQFLQTLKDNPESILEQMGINTAEFAESILNKEVELMSLTDEERKIMELETELQAIKAKEEEAKKAQEEMQAKVLRDEYAAGYEKELMEAMEQGQLPNSPYIINKMVDYMSIAMKQGIDMSFADIIPIIQDERKSELHNQVQGMSAEDILALLSDKTVNDIVLKKMPKVKKKAPPTSASIKESVEPKQVDTGVKYRNTSTKDFFKNLGNKYASE